MSPEAAESLEAVRQLLPWWLPWGRDAALLISAAVLTAIGSGAGIWFTYRPFRKAAPAHWSERARLAHPVRAFAKLCLWYFPSMFFGAGLLGNSAFSAIGSIPRALLAFAIAMFVGGLFWRNAENRFRTTSLSAIETVQSMATNLLVFLPHFFVALLAVLIIPDELNRQAVLVLMGAGLLSGMLLSTWRMHIPVALGLARPADARMQAIVKRAAADAEAQGIAAYEIQWPVINAMIFPASQALTVSNTALRELSDGELETLCRHLCGYLNASRQANATRVMTGVAICLCLASMRPAIGSFGYYGLLGIAVAYFILVRLLFRFARRVNEEVGLDSQSTETKGDLARALERICALELKPAVMPGKRPVEPHLYDRLLAAGIQPDFPRPEPPPRGRSRAAMACGSLLMIAPALFGISPQLFGMQPATKHAHELGLLVPFYDHWHIASLGYLSAQAHDWPAAATYFQAAAHLDRKSWHDLANLALVLIRLQRCDDARLALDEALHRWRRLNSKQDSPDPAPSNDDQFLKEVSEAVRHCDQRRPLRPRGRERPPGRRFRGIPEVAWDQRFQSVVAGKA